MSPARICPAPNAFGAWSDFDATEENIARTRATFEAMRPFFDDLMWINYVGVDDVAEAGTPATVYGPISTGSSR